MSPFEALYGRKCRTPLFWNQTGESQVFGPDILREAEQQVQQLPLEDLDVKGYLSYVEQPTKILEISHRVTRNRSIHMCKVQWNHHSEDEATWEREDKLRAEFPYLFDEMAEAEK